MLKTLDIQIRDPFIVPIVAEQCYYLFGSTDPNVWDGPCVGFDCYKSANLEEWEGPFPAFRAPEGFWATINFWAPEVHAWNGRYFMFASFKAAGVCRGTQILVSDTIQGPYLPHSDGPVTPRDWECLDGTFHVEAGAPYMVFCHEWVQVGDGEMRAIPLTPDLKAPAGEPLLLFKASEAPWVGSVKPGENQFVTDGPFMYRGTGDILWMLWATIGQKGYAQGLARSLSGGIRGPWTQEKTLFDEDGGHGMLFRTLDGRLALTLHQPNNSPNERPRFFVITDVDGVLRVAGPLENH